MLMTRERRKVRKSVFSLVISHLGNTCLHNNYAESMNLASLLICLKRQTSVYYNNYAESMNLASLLKNQTSVYYNI